MVYKNLKHDTYYIIFFYNIYYKICNILYIIYNRFNLQYLKYKIMINIHIYMNVDTIHLEEGHRLISYVEYKLKI